MEKGWYWGKGKYGIYPFMYFVDDKVYGLYVKIWFIRLMRTYCCNVLMIGNKEIYRWRPDRCYYNLTKGKEG